MDRPTCGKYLVLVDSEDAPRALLFAGSFDYLAELEHDSLTVDHLVQGGRPCPPPQPLSSNQLLRQMGKRVLGCYELGE
ncbi:MAG TPA: hypothetical protein VNO84_09695 [Burkholderiaceae bacterium]|nr:hypothetical protein [Burkholderiaceae bacterium]